MRTVTEFGQHARLWAALLLGASLQACSPQGGAGEGRGIEGHDPLHEQAIELPGEASLWLPPLPRRPREIKPLVAPPTFSPGIFPCSRCHEGGPGIVDTAPALPHLLHLEQGLTCTDCHESEDDPVLPKVDLCLSCHDDPEVDLDGVVAYFAAIVDGQGGWRLPRRWATRDIDVHHDVHAFVGIDCSHCHGEVSDAPFLKPRPAALKQLCLECHGTPAPEDCQTCHAEIREPAHKDIILRHAEEQRGCLDCHDADDRDVLRLANGSPLSFDESYRLCGQCHGTQLRDWRDGLHGKRTGMWDGEATSLLCVHCHRDPHQPSFPSMTPLPPPMRPEDIR
jgi:hypothetical protein